MAVQESIAMRCYPKVETFLAQLLSAKGQRLDEPAFYENHLEFLSNFTAPLLKAEKQRSLSL